MKKIEMHIYYVEFTDEWHLDLTKSDQTEYLAFSSLENLVQYLATFDTKELM